MMSALAYDREEATRDVWRMVEFLGRHAARNVMRRMITYSYPVSDLGELVDDECEVFRLSIASADKTDAASAEAAFRYWLIQEGKVLSDLVDTAGTA